MHDELPRSSTGPTDGESHADDAPLSRRRMLGLLLGVGVGAGAAAAGVAALTEPPATPVAAGPVRVREAGAPASASPSRPEPREAATPSGSEQPENGGQGEPEAEIGPALYEPGPEETVIPNAKRLAARAVQMLTTYAPGETPEEIAARAVDPALTAANSPSMMTAAGLAVAGAPLFVPGVRSVGEIVYPQLGGHQPKQVASSIMVVVRQVLIGEDDSETPVVRTVDVRLRVQDGSWALQALPSTGGQPVARPDDLSADAQAVLDDERIGLPDSARWDIHARRVDERLLSLMRRIGERHVYRVGALQSGHPVEVFGTAKTSMHTRGLAVDVWQVGGVPVAAQAGDTSSEAYELAQWLYTDGVGKLGSPWALDGFGGRSFTDDVHHDHLHVVPSRA